MSSSKLLLLYVLDVLRKHSSKDKPLNVNDITNFLEDEGMLGNIPDRKTFYNLLKPLAIPKYLDEQSKASDLKKLQRIDEYATEDDLEITDIDTKSLGWQVIAVKENGQTKGYYVVDDTLTDGEVKLLCDAVAASHFIDGTRSKEIIDKLSKGVRKNYSKEYWAALQFKKSKETYNESLFENIQILSEAIRKKKRSDSSI